MKNNLILCGFILAIALSACEKDPKLTDSPLNPGSGIGVEQVDTFTLASYTIEEQPLNGKNRDYVQLGRIDDSRMGNTSTAFYSQFRLSVNGSELGANPVLDSVILTLAVNDFYGSFDNTMNIEIYELTEDLDPDSDYDNDVSLSTGTTLLGSAMLDYDTLSQISIPMTSVFGQSLLDQFNTDVMESSDNFLDFLSGVYVKIDDGSGGDGMLEIDLTNAATRLNLYFHSDNATDSLYQYVVDNQAVTANQYNTDFSGSEVEVAFNDDTDNDEELYLSPFSSSRGLVILPDMTEFADVAINYAEISFFQADYGDAINDDFPENDRIFLYLNVGDTSLNFLPGVSVNNLAAFGGAKELVSIGGINTHKYTFNITQYIQELAKEEIDNEGLAISVLSNNGANRVKLAGATHADLPIHLELTYTKTK
ncbi:MAG: DUF4270 family protein [Chitinophagales bacterium]